MRGRSVYRHHRGIVSVNKVTCLTTQWSFGLLPSQPMATFESAGEVRVQEAMALLADLASLDVYIKLMKKGVIFFKHQIPQNTTQ